MSTLTDGISGDDAAILQANTDSSDGPDPEDPVTKGASKTGQITNFQGFQPKKVATGVRGGNSGPQSHGFQLTPGARQNPCIGPDKLA